MFEIQILIIINVQDFKIRLTFLNRVMTLFHYWALHGNLFDLKSKVEMYILY